jgi:DNA-binding transcriptional ArsR family regulator
VHAFDVLADPVRRRLLELLADGERSSGDMTNIIQAEFGLTQSAVSQHLKVLRESGFASVRVDGSRRIYVMNAQPMRDVDVWLDRFRNFWEPKLEALATEVARGKRQRRGSEAQKTDAHKALDPDAPKPKAAGGRER